MRDRIGAQIGAPVKHGSVHVVDIFTSAPTVPSDNHDKAPGADPVASTQASDDVTTQLVELGAGQNDMFNQGVKRKDRPKTPPGVNPPMKKKPKIPPSPSAVRERAARVEISEYSGRIGQELNKLRGASMYHRASVGGIETLIYGMDKAMHIGGTPVEKEMYRSTSRPAYIDRLNKHKKRFSINVVDLISRY